MWEVTLSDGSVVQQDGDYSLWRRTMNACHDKGLYITSFRWEGEEVDARGTRCFIINDIVGSPGRGLVRARVGLGTFRPNGKGRIQWKTVFGDPKYGNYSEVVKPEYAEKYLEISVERKVDENEGKKVAT